MDSDTLKKRLKKRIKIARSKTTNSWGKVASWYDNNLSKDDTYQNKVILPRLLELIKPSKVEKIVEKKMLDLACGQGFFAFYFQDLFDLVGVDISENLINIAKKKCTKAKFFVSKAENINFLKIASFDTVLTVLALQNIKGVSETVCQVARVLKTGGKWHIVLNHPCYRQPKHSSWNWNNYDEIQERSVNKYLTPYESVFIMNPGNKDPQASISTFSYHHSIQDLMKIFRKNGFAITNLEEWISHKKQDQGPKTEALETAKNEIPMFMYLELTKL